MADIPDFDLDEALDFLNPYIESHAKGSKEWKAFSLAQIALLYIRDRAKMDDFKKYYNLCFDTDFTVEVSHEFATREEADQWLASGKAKHTERVKIGGKGFMVVEVSGRLYLMIAPLPEELKTEEWADDSE
ncbi:hypothetical protein [Archangium violaceum]|uniref:hypothetical protein n=1 Tax=Archangium violaceum TaxID=83451 RepID=UPI0036DA59BC